MLAVGIATETLGRLNETYNPVKGNLPVLVKKISIGDRLIEAFGTSDKAYIAKKLGFASVQAVYKVLNGERELDFEKLINFHNSTKRSIDWLLTGKAEEPAKAETPTLEEAFEHRMREIARDEVQQLLGLQNADEEPGVTIEPLTPADVMLAPVVARIGPAEEEPGYAEMAEAIRRQLLGDMDASEIERRLKKKTG